MRPAALAALVSSGVPLRIALDELGVESIQDDLILLAIKIGAPLVPTLEVLEQQLVHRERADAELKQAQAIPEATRRLLLWLPAGTVIFSQLAGLETLQGLMTPLGLLAALLALGFLYAGAKISKSMIARLSSAPNTQAHSLLALQICISSGMGLSQISQLIPSLTPRAQELIAMSQRTGAGLKALVQSEISASNERAISEQLTQAKKLSVSLLIPLTATTLPAFLLLTIVPMIIGITQ